MSRVSWVSGVGAVTLLLTLQLIPVARDNPPVSMDVPAPVAAKAILRRACYDCHSHETRWPWYASIAPVSWLTAHDVRAARARMDFSTWDRIDPVARRRAMRAVAHHVALGHMPPWYYGLAHRDARLTASDRAALRDWAIATAHGTAPAADLPQP